MTEYADLRFFAGLRDFLDADRGSGVVTRSFDERRSVATLIEACGVPPGEVALVVANGEPVGLDHRVAGGDHISVYPSFTALPVDAPPPTEAEGSPGP